MVGNKPASKQQTSQMLFLMIGLAAVIFILIYNRQVGEIMHHVMYPLLGFGGKYVVPTLMLTGMLMIGLSTIIRTIMTDMVKQTRNQKEMSAFNAELRQARIENNLYKIKKLTEQQKEMMSKSMESSMNMMKTLPITMVIIMPLFAWVNYFLSNFAQSIQIAVPWAEAVIITESMLLPIWIFVYMLITMPFAQILGRAIRWFKFKKRLEELDAGTAS